MCAEMEDIFFCFWFKVKNFSGNYPNRKNLPICIKCKHAFFLRTTLPLCDFVIFMYKVRPKNKYIYVSVCYIQNWNGIQISFCQKYYKLFKLLHAPTKTFISNFMSHKKFDLLLLIHKMRKCEIWFGPSGFFKSIPYFFLILS